jgi:glycosyltransferase involved in cell wall biosynthesis
MEELFIDTLIFYIFCGAAFFQLFYFLFFYLRLANYKPKEVKVTQYPPVSIIICARNEDTNLKKNLPKILSQDYPAFEVIVVDDNSDDGTTEYLFFLSQKEPRLKRTKTGNSNRMMAGKKFPLTLGLRAAANDLVLLTDADCYPASNQWLKHMVAGYAGGKEIVLGYGAYEKKSDSLNRRIRYETVITALNYFSYALARLPYMGVGRNLSYNKSLFFNTNGFFDHRHIPSGDDDLFINKVANKRNTEIVIHPEAFTYSEPKETREDWIEQKNRHLSTAKYYRFKHQFWLGLQPISHILFWFTSIYLFVTVFVYWYIVAAAFVVRWILLRYTFSQTMNKLDEKDLKPYIEWYDIVQIAYYFRFAKAALIKTKYRWD